MPNVIRLVGYIIHGRLTGVLLQPLALMIIRQIPDRGDDITSLRSAFICTSAIILRGACRGGPHTELFEHVAQPGTPVCLVSQMV